MKGSRSLSASLVLSIAAVVSPVSANAQYNPAPQAPPPVLLLGTAHVDGPTDHDDIKVGRYAGRFHSIRLSVQYAPIQFDHVVIHYGDGQAETLPVRTFIAPGQGTRWIVLPGGRRVIHSLELWYARAEPGNPTRPEVALYGVL